MRPVSMLGLAASCAALVSLGISGSVSAQAAEVGSLLITCPATCRVSVDGRDVGEAPAVVSDLLPGQHLVEATAPDGSRFGGLAEVTAGRSTAFEVQLEPASGPPAPHAPAPGAAPAAVEAEMRAAMEAGATELGLQAGAEPLETALDAGRAAPPSTSHARGAVTTAPDSWDGGLRSYPAISVLAFVLGGLTLLGGGGMLIYADSLHAMNPDRDGFTLAGGIVTPLGGIFVALGVVGLFFMKGPGPAERTGTVYFGAVELEPLFGASPEGAFIGGRARW